MDCHTVYLDEFCNKYINTHANAVVKWYSCAVQNSGKRCNIEANLKCDRMIEALKYEKNAHTRYVSAAFDAEPYRNRVLSSSLGFG